MRIATLGFDVYRFQLAAYVIAGALGGPSGFLLANASEFVSPAFMSWQRSGELIIMVLLGGSGSLIGAIVGTAAYLLAEEWLAGVTEHWKVIFGPVLVLVVLFARGGLVGLASALLRRVRPWLSRAAPRRRAQERSAALVVTDDVTFDVHAERAACRDRARTAPARRR